MSPVRFVFAMPAGEEQEQRDGIARVSRASDVCGSVPALWTGEGTPLTDLGAAGRIVGIVFSRGSPGWRQALAAKAASGRGVERLAAWLLRECWGAYFAVLADPAGGAIRVLVDPSGLLAVYRLETPDHVILTSHPGLLGDVCGRRPGICWPALRSHLCRPELRQRKTCLAGVTELAPGTLSGSHGAERQLWDPGGFLPKGRRYVSFDDAAHELRDIAVRAVGSWAECLGPVAVAASGGVDSSLLCAALASGGKPFSCVTLATSDPSGDERAYVRMLANGLGAFSHAAPYAAGKLDPRTSASDGLPRPSRKSFMSAVDSALAAARDSVGACAVLDGNGGDNLFCFLHSAGPVADRLRCEGAGIGAWSTFLDMCRLTGSDAPTMARAVLRRLARRRPGLNLWPADTRLLAEGYEGLENSSPLTPWLEIPVGPHRSKRDHLALIMRAQNHVHGLGAGLPRFSPLMSQPLVEFCLGIPSWIWCRGGINRALARAAFADVLPREILQRTSKAGPDSFVRHAFESNRSSIRELLLDGLLARRGLLDLAAVERALCVDAVSGDSIVYRLLDLAEAENWAQSWIG